MLLTGLNGLDVMLTKLAMGIGMVEGNPLLVGMSLWEILLLKMTLVLAAIWMTYRIESRLGLGLIRLAVVCYSALIGYEIWAIA